jgi:hypothetical protein
VSAVLDPTTSAPTGASIDIGARDVAVMPGFNSQGSWELANRIGKAFAASTLVPEAYRGNVANCIVALEMANRMGASPLMVMQNLYIVHGNPGWSAKFLVACFNQCGRFSALRYEWTADRSACRAWAIEKATGERIDGPQVSVEMARAEGWSTKSGSKWKTMPELMLMYRAAAFLIRTYAPEISMGLQTDDEIIEAQAREVTPTQSLEAVRGAIAATTALPPAPGQSPQPTFDLAAFIARAKACTDLATLQIMNDEAEAMPEGGDRDAALEVIRARDAELG